MEESTRLSLYEKNLNMLKEHYRILYDEYIRFEKNLGSQAPDDHAEVEAVIGRRGHHTFILRARVTSECSGGPLQFPAFQYKRNTETILEKLELASRDGNAPTDIKFAPVSGPRLMPRFHTSLSEIKQIHGHSLFDPVKDAEKRFKDETVEENDRFVLLGFGFGYEVRELLKLAQKSLIVVIEPYVSVFKKALETVDLSDIFLQHRVVMSFSLDPGDLQYVLLAHTSHLYIPNFKVRTLPHVSLYPELYKIVLRTKRELMTFVMFNLVTGMFAGPVFQNNLVMNFIPAMKNPGVCLLDKKFEGKPIFVVAPGPSLDKNVEQLKRVKGKALIICCDTATSIMLRHGIETDVITTIDYQPANFFKLRGVDTSFAYLFPSLEVTPHILLNHKGPMFNYYHSALTEKVFDPILGRKGCVHTGGSVLTDAFSIAVSMGADPVILLGVDLGFPGMKWYSEGSFDNGKFTSNLNEKKVDLIEIEDIYGNPMYTYRSFYEFLKWFRKRLAVEKINVVDATEGGAKIEGSRIMKLSDAIDEFVTDGYNPRGILDDVYNSFTPPTNEEVLSKVNEYIRDYEELTAEMRKTLKSCKRALEIMRRSQKLEGNKELIRLLLRINESRSIFKVEKNDSRLGFVSPMIERQMTDILYYTQDETKPKRERHIRLVELDRNFYEKLAKACENMKYHMETIRDEIMLEDDHEEFI